MAKRRAWVVAALTVFVAGAGQTRAAPMRYTFQGTGSGTVGGTPFTNAAFTINVYADTANITAVSGSPGISYVDASSATLALGGVGTGSFSLGTRVFDNQPVSALGFSRAGTNGSDLLDMYNSAFQTYGLASAFGPVFVASPGAVNQFNNVPTTLGTLTFNSAQSVTFTATPQAQALPEPSALVLLSLGIPGLLGYVRRRRQPARSVRRASLR